MKYYDFVSHGWCHIRERPARLVSNAFLYTTTEKLAESLVSFGSAFFLYLSLTKIYDMIYSKLLTLLRGTL